jgi:hypothetical protein
MRNKSALSIFALAAAFTGMSKGPQFAIAYDDVQEYDPEDINAGGTEIDIYYCPRKDFLVLQDVGAVSTVDEFGVVAAAHTFTSPAGWYKLRAFVPDQQSVQHESGQYGGGWKNTARVFLKGNQAIVRGICQQLNNDDCIFIIPLKDGERAQIGSKHGIATVKPGFDSKTDSSQDPRGWELMLECIDTHPVYYGSGLALTLHS